VTRRRQHARTPDFTSPVAAALAAEENRRFVELVGSLDDSDWARPTDCPDWDVRQVVAHVLGAMEGQVSLRELAHQVRAGKKAAGDRADLDGMTDVQVREREHLSPGQLVERLARTGPRAAAARARRPELMRRLPFTQDLPAVGIERWTFAYLLDVIWTRDTWMHRVDISRATDRPLRLTPDHDGRIVADVAQDWAARHGQPVVLTLTGPAGGVVTSGQNGPDLQLDAVEFCRVVSGRSVGTGLLSCPVPF
jgi:uncharacterized protein (TIGR03083 family)